MRKPLWSATPTIWKPKEAGLAWDADFDAMEVLREHHKRVGISGVFVAGTNGVGKLMSHEDMSWVVQAWREDESLLDVAVNVTANSEDQVLARIDDYANYFDANYAVVAPPPDHNAVWDESVARAMLMEIIERSPMLITLYDLDGRYAWPVELLCDALENSKVAGIKVSSESPARWGAIVDAASRASHRPFVFGGIEYRGDEQLNAGMDGLLTGAAGLTHFLTSRQLDAETPEERAEIQKEITDLLTRIFGGNPYADMPTPLRTWQTGQLRLLQLGLGEEVVRSIQTPTWEHLRWNDEDEWRIQRVFDEFGERMFPKAA